MLTVGLFAYTVKVMSFNNSLKSFSFRYTHNIDKLSFNEDVNLEDIPELLLMTRLKAGKFCNNFLWGDASFLK